MAQACPFSVSDLSTLMHM